MKSSTFHLTMLESTRKTVNWKFRWIALRKEFEKTIRQKTGVAPAPFFVPLFLNFCFLFLLFALLLVMFCFCCLSVFFFGFPLECIHVLFHVNTAVHVYVFHKFMSIVSVVSSKSASTGWLGWSSP